MPLEHLEEKLAEEIERENLSSIKGRIYLPLVFHVHQPVGNFPWVFEDAFEKSYEPLLSALERHSDVSAGLHITGPVLDWLEIEQPAFLDRVRSLVKGGQVELLGGGYYEPILAVIPDRDKLAQIQLMTTRLQDLVAATPKGFWLAERAWEPHLPQSLAKGKLEYVLIDDNHIRACGIDESELLHVFATEDGGESIAVFPINKQIRYLTPWKPAVETFLYLSELISEDDPEQIVTSIDDAEKFGTWPAGDRTTYDICYGSGYNGFPWIDMWFGFLEQLSWVKSCTPGDFLSQFKPKRLVYLPTASYDKMDRWALPTPRRREVEGLVKDLKHGRIFSVDIHEQKTDMNEIVRSHLRGGFWRHFLIKYPESNRMHKRMMFARESLLAAEDIPNSSPEHLKKAWIEIYKAQCNDVFWHGLFAGVYYQFLRRETYRHILQAEKLVEPLLNLEYPCLGESSVEIPGQSEIIMENESIRVFIRPNDGCVVQEIDLKTKSENINCVLTRHEEAYHSSEIDFQVDKWRKASFRNWILPVNFETNDLLASKIPDEYGIASGTYKMDSKTEKSATFRYNIKHKKKHFSFTKKFSLDDEETGFTINYQISNENIPDNKSLSLALYTEICLIISDSLDTLNLEKTEDSVIISDKQTGLAVEINCNKGTIAAIEPIVTLLKSEGEWQPSYQGHSIFLHIPLEKMHHGQPGTVQLKLR
ncbi:MAG: alpha-amylase/4-alpha-glucanotransferase domain-containing protein [Candidatus Heimdallarchaeota archaeon]